MWLKINNETCINLDLIKYITFYGVSTSGNYRIHIDGKDFYVSRSEENQIKQFMLSVSYYPVTSVGNASQDIHTKIDGLFAEVTKHIHAEIISQKLAIEAESTPLAPTPTPTPSNGMLTQDVKSFLGSLSKVLNFIAS
jgi:hypothetical protein